MNDEEQESLYDKEVGELHDMMEAYGIIKEMNDSHEPFRPVANRSERRAASRNSRKRKKNHG